MSTDNICGTIIPTPFTIVILSAPETTQMIAEKKKGVRYGNTWITVWRIKTMVRPGRTVTVKFNKARNKIPTAQGFFKLNSTPPTKK